MSSDVAKDILLKFERGIEKLPEFNDEKEKKIFLHLQRYNLLFVNTEGELKITSKGEEALKGNVEKFLELERFEQRLIKDSLKRNTERKWIVFGVAPLIVLLALLVLFLQTL